MHVSSGTALTSLGVASGYSLTWLHWRLGGVVGNFIAGIFFDNNHTEIRILIYILHP